MGLEVWECLPTKESFSSGLPEQEAAREEEVRVRLSTPHQVPQIGTESNLWTHTQSQQSGGGGGGGGVRDLGGEGGGFGEVVGKGGREEVAIERIISSQCPDKVGVCVSHRTTLHFTSKT